MSLYSFRKSQVDAAAAGEAVTPDAAGQPAAEAATPAQPAFDAPTAASATASATPPEYTSPEPMTSEAVAPAPAPAAPEQTSARVARPNAQTRIGRVLHMDAAEAFGASPEAFHAWVAANLDLAGEPTGQSWTDMTTDRRADGSPWPLVAAGPTGLGIFEAEAGESTAACLGRLVTSMVEVGATTAVWLAGEPRPEHAAVVAWLNASGADIQVYLVKVAAIRIDDSIPAPVLTTVVRPGRVSDESLPSRAEPEPEPDPVPESRISRMMATAAAVEPAAPAQDDGASEPAAAESSPPAEPEPAAEAFEARTSALLSDTGRRSSDWTRRALGLRSDEQS